MEEKILQVDEDNAYSRLDVFLSTKCDKSRSYIIKAIKEGNVKVNGRTILKPSFIVNNNDEVSFALLEDVHALSFSRRKPVHHAHGANRCRQIQEAHDSPELTHRQP